MRFGNGGYPSLIHIAPISAVALFGRPVALPHARRPHECVFGVPYLSSDPTFPHPITGTLESMGGTRLGNEQARRQTWARLLSFLSTG
jgi:hypothetical protein